MPDSNPSVGNPPPQSILEKLEGGDERTTPSVAGPENETPAGVTASSVPQIRELTLSFFPSGRRALRALMESHSDLRFWFQRRMREILTEIRSVDLFAEAGLHPREGLLSEAW